MRAVLAIAWGLLAAALLLGEGARTRGLTRTLARARGLRCATWNTVSEVPVGGKMAASGRRRQRRRAEAVDGRDLALASDLLAVAMGAGLTPRLALQVAARSSPPEVADRLAAVLCAAEGGAGLTGALEAEAGASPALRPLIDALLATERLGAPVVGVLGRLAADGRARARRADLARARSVPVRLLFPLVFLVLPAFLLLTVAPVLLAGFGP